MNSVETTKATIADAEAITRLVNLAYRPVPGAEGWTHESALVSGSRVNREMVMSAIQSSTILVGSRGQDLVGCVQTEMKGKAAHIGMLAVDPALQSHGVGKLLLEKAEEYAVKEHDAEIGVLTVIAARTELIKYYIRRGYTQTGEKLQYPVDAGVGIPGGDAMLLTRLQKFLNTQRHDDHLHAQEEDECIR